MLTRKKFFFQDYMYNDVLHFMINEKYYIFGKLPCDKASKRQSGKRSGEG